MGNVREEKETGRTGAGDEGRAGQVRWPQVTLQHVHPFPYIRGMSRSNI